MKRIVSFYRFDIRTMRFLFLIPIISWVVSLVLINLQTTDYDKYYDSFLIVQGIYIPFSCWWMILRLTPVYEDGAVQTLSPYYQKYLWFDIIRYAIAYLLGLMSLVIVIIMKYDTSVIDYLLLIHFILLVFLYILMGALSIIISRTLEVSMTMIFLYTVLEVVTQGSFMPWPHIFQFEPPLDTVLYEAKILRLGLLTIFLALLVSFAFKKSRNEK